MGTAEVLSAPASPWQNPYVERVIGSIRRECLDHVIVGNESHLRRVLSSYLLYYHRSRTHLGLNKDTPDRRPIAETSVGPIIDTHAPTTARGHGLRRTGSRRSAVRWRDVTGRGTHPPHPQRDHPCQRERRVLSGGFGLWELIYQVIGTVIGFRALQSYRWIAVGWLIHACWDIVHHLWGNPIWPFMPTSAFGGMIFDSMIAVRFLAGAPSFLKRPHVAMRTAGA